MKRLSVMITALSVLVFASFAFAANRVEVKVTSEPIQYHATCGKAGGFSLEFDANSILQDGDQITIDLPYATATDRVTLCRNIDMIISPRNATIAPVDLNNLQPEDVYTDTPGYTPIPLEGVNSPIFYKGTAPTYTALGGVLFRVRGTAGGSRITLDVIGYKVGDSVTVGPLADDKVVIKLFDQAEYLSVPFGLLKVSDVDPDVYDAFATAIDNVIRINVSSWTGSVVKASMDSKDDKFTFIPSDPQIAHIVPITLQPDIKANGSDGPVGITLGDTLSITVELYPGFYPGYPADWWCVADSPFGWYYYDAGTGEWLPGFHVSHQGPLFELTPPFEVLNMSDLPIAGYTFYFGIDGNMNGNVDEPLFYDSVEVNITP